MLKEDVNSQKNENVGPCEMDGLEILSHVKMFADRLKWLRAVEVVTNAKHHSSKPELMFCARSNPARDVSEICDGEDPIEWSWLEIRLKVFLCSTTPQKQCIIIINITNIAKEDLVEPITVE